MNAKRGWLTPYSWEFITAQNAALCQAKNALHKPTSDGHAATQELWESMHQTDITLEEAVELCRRCHRMAPFCFYNGNTFAAIIRDVVMQLNVKEAQKIVLRSLAGHIVAGVASEEEVRAFRDFCATLA